MWDSERNIQKRFLSKVNVMFKIAFKVDEAKKHRTLRFCGDFRVIIRTLLEVKQYFVPKIENSLLTLMEHNILAK